MALCIKYSGNFSWEVSLRKMDNYLIRAMCNRGLQFSKHDGIQTEIDRYFQKK